MGKTLRLLAAPFFGHRRTTVWAGFTAVILAGASFAFAAAGYYADHQIIYIIYRVFTGLLLGALGVSLLLSYFTYTVNHLHEYSQKRIHNVGPNLYQSGELRIGDTYANLGVDMILDLSYDPGFMPVVPNGKVYLRWPIEDRDPPDPFMLAVGAQGVAAISMHHPVLIKCDLGVNRSGLVVREVLKYQSALNDNQDEEQKNRMFNQSFIDQFEDKVTVSHMGYGEMLTQTQPLSLDD